LFIAEPQHGLQVAAVIAEGVWGQLAFVTQVRFEFVYTGRLTLKHKIYPAEGRIADIAVWSRVGAAVIFQ